MAVTNSKCSPEKPSLSSLASPCLLLCSRTTKAGTVKPLRKSCIQGQCEPGLCKRSGSTQWPRPASSQESGARKNAYFFHPKLLLPRYFHGWTLEERQYWQFIHPLLCLCSDTKVNVHRGQKESDSCCYFTMKSKLGSECCSRDSWKVICKVTTVSLNLAVW